MSPRQFPRAALHLGRRLSPADRPVPGRMTVPAATRAAVPDPGPQRTRRRMATPPWARALGYWLYQYKRTWRGSITTSFLYPVLYLSAIGVGLGSLVNHHAHTVDGVKY